MITQTLIKNLYKTHCKSPNSADDLNIELLFGLPIEYHDIEIDDAANLILNRLPSTSPLRKIALRHIHAIVEIERWIAIVLRYSILFLNRCNSDTYIHIREDES